MSAPILSLPACSHGDPSASASPALLASGEVEAIRSKIDACENLGLGDAVAVAGDLVCFSGVLDEGDDDALRNVLDGAPSARTLVIRSPGGIAYHSIRIAEVVHAYKLDVVVWDYCTSGCSNYVFMAGGRKYLLEGALLGFHGGPLQSVDQLAAGLRSNASLAALTDAEVLDRAEVLWADDDFEFHRQERFFASLGMRTDIVYAISRLQLAEKLVELDVDSRMRRLDGPQPDTISIGWFPSPARMYDEYGVEGIWCQRCEFGDDYTIDNSITRGFLLFESLD